MSTAVASVIASSVFFLVAIILVAVFGSVLMQYSNTLARLYEMRKQDLEISKAVVLIESVTYSNNCLLVSLANRGPSSLVVDGQTTILVDYTATTGERLVKILQHGISWLIEEVTVGSYRHLENPSAAELKPGAKAIIKMCLDPLPEISKPVVIVFVGRYGVRAEYVYTLS
ncbi:MAG: hypothetical protein RMI56_04405 [Sulfolobales archaeon]|nr:hypothetical protein [Sulfolobales archaeon]MDW8083025.1 hypothetical protein [Sulfolobales archaeon]